MEYVRISKERIGALIGRSGETKAELERKAKVKILVDSESGEVTISENKSDPLLTWIARDVVSAISHGFSPKKAFLLFEDGYYFDVIELHPPKKEDCKRVISRVIGTTGKTREYIERTTKTYLAIGEDTISIIGTQDGLGIAKNAIEMLVEGKPHITVYKFLDRSAI